MNDLSIEDRIAAKTDLTIAGQTAVSESVGGLAFKDMGQVLEFSKLMAVSQQAVPVHLRNKPGACMAITLQALNWRMDPFAVANKSYMVNDRIAYEAQLIHAVIEQRAPIKGRIKGKVDGDGAARRWNLSVVTDEGDTIEFEGQEIGKITTKNSPLWKADPDQQLWYYSVRAMCRRHFPDVILGVYEKEEMAHAEGLRDVTPMGERQNLAQRLAKPAPAEAEVITPEPHWTEAVAYQDAFPGSQAWDHGVAAFEDGKPSTDCPYDEDLKAAADWLGGYFGAKAPAE